MAETAKIMNLKTTDWVALAEKLGPEMAARASDVDQTDAFVAENIALLREHGFYSAAVPTELGGGGASHSEMCRAIQTLGRYCGSTALTLSMHQHLVAAPLWKHMRGQPGEALLKKVAADELVLVSTGAKDWLDSNGTLTRVEGGYRLNARKFFASGSLAGDILVTSAQYDDPEEGELVCHFAVPFSAEGLRVDNNWQTMGMRGTGSNTVILEDVFVPEEAIALRRPRSAYHGVWNLVIGVALPLICSAYVGVAEAAAQIAREQCAGRADDGVLPLQLGEMENALTTAQVAWESMVALSNDLRFETSVPHANEMLKRKTITVKAALAVTEKALEAVGGAGFFRPLGLERLIRDAHAGQFHPLPEKKQQRFSGRLALGLDPIS